jgi:hypothetical protein
MPEFVPLVRRDDVPVHPYPASILAVVNRLGAARLGPAASVASVANHAGKVLRRSRSGGTLGERQDRLLRTAGAFLQRFLNPKKKRIDEERQQ